MPVRPSLRLPREAAPRAVRASTLGACLVAAALAAGVPPAVLATPVSAEWASKWREDLAFARARFPEVHANLFHSMPRDAFEAELDRLAARVPALSHHAIAVELARIVARVGDGHTRVTLPLDPSIGSRQGHSETDPPAIPGFAFHQYPIRLDVFDGGLHVTDIERSHARLLGARVTRIGDLDAGDAVARVVAIVHRDNDPGILRTLPELLVLPEVLHARGVIAAPGGSRWTFEDAAGRTATLRLDPVSPGRAVRWASWDPNSAARPLWLADPETFFWLRHLPEHRAVYVGFNRVANREGETLAAFARRVRTFVDSTGSSTLILDLRHNDGGDATLNRALVHELIRMEEHRERGWLHAIVGRHTFSAALMLLVDLERHTRAVLVGEPVGSKPHHYGDARKVRLPNSGITVRLSTIDWRLGGPRDRRDTIEPHVPVAMTAADWRAGRDPALEWILGLAPTAQPPEGRWRGSFAAGPDTRFDIGVTFDAAGERLGATIDVAAAELRGAPLEAVASDGAHVRFTFRHPSGPLHFRGTRYGDWILGSVDMAGREGSWELRRVPAR